MNEQEKTNRKDKIEDFAKKFEPFFLIPFISGGKKGNLTLANDSIKLFETNINVTKNALSIEKTTNTTLNIENAKLKDENVKLANKNTELAKKNAELTNKNTELTNTELAKKNAELTNAELANTENKNLNKKISEKDNALLKIMKELIIEKANNTLVQQLKQANVNCETEMEKIKTTQLLFQACFYKNMEAYTTWENMENAKTYFMQMCRKESEFNKKYSSEIGQINKVNTLDELNTAFNELLTKLKQNEGSYECMYDLVTNIIKFLDLLKKIDDNKTETIDDLNATNNAKLKKLESEIETKQAELTTKQAELTTKTTELTTKTTELTTKQAESEENLKAKQAEIGIAEQKYLLELEKSKSFIKSLQKQIANLLKQNIVLIANNNLLKQQQIMKAPIKLGKKHSAKAKALLELSSLSQSKQNGGGIFYFNGDDDNIHIFTSEEMSKFEENIIALKKIITYLTDENKRLQTELNDKVTATVGSSPNDVVVAANNNAICKLINSPNVNNVVTAVNVDDIIVDVDSNANPICKLINSANVNNVVTAVNVDDIIVDVDSNANPICKLINSANINNNGVVNNNNTISSPIVDADVDANNNPMCNAIKSANSNANSINSANINNDGIVANNNALCIAINNGASNNNTNVNTMNVAANSNANNAINNVAAVDSNNNALCNIITSASANTNVMNVDAANVSGNNNPLCNIINGANANTNSNNVVSVNNANVANTNTTPLCNIIGSASASANTNSNNVVANVANTNNNNNNNNNVINGVVSVNNALCNAINNANVANTNIINSFNPSQINERMTNLMKDLLISKVTIKINLEIYNNEIASLNKQIEVLKKNTATTIATGTIGNTGNTVTNTATQAANTTGTNATNSNTATTGTNATNSNTATIGTNTQADAKMLASLNETIAKLKAELKSGKFVTPRIAFYEETKT